jgi:hypothetical protein
MGKKKGNGDIEGLNCKKEGPAGTEENDKGEFFFPLVLLFCNGKDSSISKS